MTTESSTYPIGRPGVPWGAEEKNAWLNEQTQKRSYFYDVLAVVERLAEDFDVVQYGELAYAEYGFADYPLVLLKSKNWQLEKPTVIVTGGVHGYETSGVHGALRFLQTEALNYTEQFNVLVAPCISPWGYETINRWNPETTDPNRSFLRPSPAPEAAQIMDYVAAIGGKIVMHIDLHETTDTDNSEFRPALAARDGIVNDNWNIPDGFYLVGDSQDPAAAFQKSVLDSVAKVTHIAEADESGKLIGVPLAQFGVINYDGKKYGLCMGLSGAEYVTTTEVYPDSANATPEECIQAQVAAIVGGLNYVAAHTGS
ncbi:peptidase [Aliidiomarina iranensis]|uniref:Peptidase n=1 Tax=Aliidiomarina iranensis TaxID=1434071 RepID=A0A432W0P7_9GAMM|nr:M14 family metallocarboxypeptidase [Aliidiomarina iranensis]RUO22589.1 peptidase [Aliidiomarina iranensis]